MPSDDIESLSTANTDNYLVPVTIDKEPITFNGNDATIEGTLYECGRFYKRNGLFQTLFAHRAVALSNGKLAVESPNTAASAWIVFCRSLAPVRFCLPDSDYGRMVSGLDTRSVSAACSLVTEGLANTTRLDVFCECHSSLRIGPGKAIEIVV